ncbi:membrane protein [Hypericibacter adhaerens]|uniref:Membrane protein n=1 Tax=Hypericibacter adhaerens TaxID=2602016 RepID=A0A5J6N580_9PROT|nr:membrane protein [Hypericibacter adhaerens]
MQRWVRLFLSLFAASVFVVLLVPFQPWMPTAQLDPSWVLGLNQAVAQGLVFGRDIIFTGGPYAAAVFEQYHPATYLTAVVVTLLFAAFFFAAFQAISRGTGALWTVVLLLSVLVVVASKLALLTAYGLILSIVLVRHCAEDGDDESPPRPLLVAALFVPLGLIPLTKINLLLSTAALIPVQLAFLWLKGRKGLAVCSLAVPAATLVATWLLAGQPLDGLPAYFETGFSVIAGYSDAMSSHGPIKEVIVYALMALAILLAVILSPGSSRLSALLLFLSFAAYLFLSLKAAFVRHDGHAFNAAAALVVAAALLKFAIPRNLAVTAAVLASIAGAGYIESHYVKLTASLVAELATRPYIKAATGLERAITGGDLETTYLAQLAAIRAETKIPPLAGTVDIYSYGQAALIASGNKWAPRPNLQSHAAYTPALADADRAYLLERGPDNVIFRIEPIDARYPSLEDGSSWPVLLGDYRLDKAAGDYLYLRRRDDVSAPDLRPVSEGACRFDEPIGLPDSDKPLFLKIGLRKTLLGQLASLLFRVPAIMITAELENGETRQYRLIPGMTEAGFIVSPLVENIQEFAAFYGDEAALAGKRVKSFQISGRWIDLLWHNPCEIGISTIEPRPGG